MPKKITSINIDEDTWHNAKKRALDLKKPISSYIEELIQRDIGE